MKTQSDKIQEQQNTLVQRITKEPSTGGTATIADHRPATVYQRKLRETMANSPLVQAHAPLRETMNAHAAGKALPIQRKAPKGSSRFQQIATAMGEKHGVDTSGLAATHNSSFPGKLNAEATIQGNKIHFAPGMDSDYNIRHEVAHAIDNTLNGIPKGDRVVNRQKVDTTREKVADRMAKEGSLLQPSLTAPKTKKAINNGHSYPSVANLSVPSKKNEPLVQRLVVAPGQRNVEADTNARDYVHDNANSNWFEVIRQYKRGELHHPGSPDPTARTRPYGMQTLLDDREDITEEILEEAKPETERLEKEKRKNLYLKIVLPMDRYPVNNSFINDIKPLAWNAPGSGNPTSDIDINLRGDGTELAVQWINRRFKNDLNYGRGKESGEVYDVNFYAQDFVPPGVFGLKGNHSLDKVNATDYYYGSDDWRTHRLRTPTLIQNDKEQQNIASMLMMRVNMTLNDWTIYTGQLRAEAGQQHLTSVNTLITNAEARYAERQATIDRFTPVGQQPGMASENRAYESVLVDEVAEARIRFQYWKKKLDTNPNNADFQRQADEAYFKLKAAKSKALAYANEAYYTQGAVIGVVVNKQILENMFEPGKPERYKKLELTPAEYYHGFNEQIGFAIHSLDNAPGVQVHDLVKLGKYVHRAYNMFKHFCRVTNADFTRYFTEEERKAASNWEGIKHGLFYSKPFKKYIKSRINKESDLDGVLKTILGNTYPGVNGATNLNNTKNLLKDKLIALKIKFDRLYLFN